jgi:very-short-patch-repair endonuclease
MTKLYNRKSSKERRKSLRNNATKAERLFWLGLRDSNCGARFRRQYGVDNFILDFYSPEIRLGIELDGDYHNTDEELAHDAWRQAIIEKYDIKIIRFRDEEILNGYDAAAAVVKAEVAKRKSWPHGPTAQTPTDIQLDPDNPTPTLPL